MKYYILASGSKGNSTVVVSHGRAILIDMGLSLSEFRKRLAKTPISEEEIEAVFYTHSHGDHLRPLKFFDDSKIFATQGTINRDTINHLDFYATYQVAGFSIMVLPTSHDARDSAGFVVDDGEKRLVYMTDTGYISEHNQTLMKDANFYILESNHNVRMLLKTNRPYDLIQRILGDEGHLSNEDSAMYASELLGLHTEEIVLAHLSEEANTPDEALGAYEKILRRQRIDVTNLRIQAASQWDVTVGGDDEN